MLSLVTPGYMVFPAGLGHFPNAVELETETQTEECCPRVPCGHSGLLSRGEKGFSFKVKSTKLGAGAMKCLLQKHQDLSQFQDACKK